MSVRWFRNFGPLRNTVLSDRTLMREVGLLARERIIRRTLSGRDEKGQAFRPYSPGYAVKKGRELGGSGIVNLQVSGEMLQAIALIRVGDDFVDLGFKR